MYLTPKLNIVWCSFYSNCCNYPFFCNHTVNKIALILQHPTRDFQSCNSKTLEGVGNNCQFDSFYKSPQLHPGMEFDQSLYAIVIEAFLNMDNVLYFHVFQQNPGLWSQTDGVLQKYPVQNRIQVHINNSQLSRFWRGKCTQHLTTTCDGYHEGYRFQRNPSHVNHLDGQKSSGIFPAWLFFYLCENVLQRWFNCQLRLKLTPTDTHMFCRERQRHLFDFYSCAKPRWVGAEWIHKLTD